MEPMTDEEVAAAVRAAWPMRWEFISPYWSLSYFCPERRDVADVLLRDDGAVVVDIYDEQKPYHQDYVTTKHITPDKARALIKLWCECIGLGYEVESEPWA